MKWLNTYPTLAMRERLNDLCNPQKELFDHPTKFHSVFFPEFEGLLKVVLPPPSRLEQYNCVAYSLDIDCWVKTTVIAQAIINNELIATNNPRINDVVVYFSDHIIKHAGKYVNSSKVSSKWAGGPVFEHDTFFCPTIYGDEIRYYEKPNQNFVSQLIRKYSNVNSTW